jgi:hypothetical protein
MSSHSKASWLRQLCLFALALAMLHTTACAAHTSSVLMRAATHPESACQAALDVMGGVARVRGLRNAMPPGFEPSTLPSGSVVLAQYRSIRSAEDALAGSAHNVYVTVFGREHCQEISFAITDYESSVETDYVHEIRSTLMARLRERSPDAEIVFKETTTRALPP